MVAGEVIPNAGYVTLSRKTVIQDLARRYVVFIDGMRVGRIGPFQTKTFELTPGVHKLKLEVSLASNSGDIEISIAAGEKRTFVTRGHGFKQFSLIPLAIFMPDRFAPRPWIRLIEVGEGH